MEARRPSVNRGRRIRSRNGCGPLGGAGTQPARTQPARAQPARTQPARYVPMGPLLDLFVVAGRPYRGSHRIADEGLLLGVAQVDGWTRLPRDTPGRWRVVAFDTPSGRVVPDGPGRVETANRGSTSSCPVHPRAGRFGPAPFEPAKGRAPTAPGSIRHRWGAAEALRCYAQNEP